MKGRVRQTLVATLTVAILSWGLAVFDDGGGGGGTLTVRTLDQQIAFLLDLQTQRDALRAAISEQQLMSQLQALGLIVS